MEGVSGGLWLDSSLLETVLVDDVWSSLSKGLQRVKVVQKRKHDFEQEVTKEWPWNVESIISFD